MSDKLDELARAVAIARCLVAESKRPWLINQPYDNGEQAPDKQPPDIGPDVPGGGAV